jgi:imidazolonepropionase-like amidohydrolase
MSSLLITHAHLLDPVAGEISDASWLEVADGRIVATGTGPAPASGDDARVIDAAGATVMPGLIDAHVHVLLTTFDLHDAMNWTPGLRDCPCARRSRTHAAPGIHYRA